MEETAETSRYGKLKRAWLKLGSSPVNNQGVAMAEATVTELKAGPSIVAAAPEDFVVELFPYRVQHAEFLFPTTTVYLPELPPVGTFITIDSDAYLIITILGRPVFEPGNPRPVGIVYTLIVSGPYDTETPVG